MMKSSIYILPRTKLLQYSSRLIIIVLRHYQTLSLSIILIIDCQEILTYAGNSDCSV